MLDQTGVLGEDFIGAHLVHLDSTTLEIFGRRRIKCSHNPVANLILASGVAPVPTLRGMGLDVGLRKQVKDGDELQISASLRVFGPRM